MRWNWIHGVPAAALVIDAADRTLVAVNGLAEAQLGQAADALTGHTSEFLIPDYVFPDRSDLLGWTAAVGSGQPVGIDVDLLVERADGVAQRVEAHLGPVDGDADYLLVTLSFGASGVLGAFQTRQNDFDAVVHRLLVDVARIVGSTLDLRIFCERLALALVQAMPADRVAIALVGDTPDMFDLVYPTPEDNASTPRLDASRSPILEAMIQRTPMVLSESEINAEVAGETTLPARFGSGQRSACVVPLVSGEEEIGCVLVGSSLVNGFGAEDIELFSQISGQIAGAISNIKLLEDLKREARERDLLATVGRIAGSAVELGPALRDIALEIRNVLPVAFVAIHEFVGEEGTITETYNWTKSPRRSHRSGQLTVDYQGTADERCVELRRPVRVPHSGRQPAAMLSSMSQARDKVGDVITAPLFSSNRPVGTLTVAANRGEVYGDREISLIGRVASQISGAVHTARLYQEQFRESEIRRILAAIGLSASQDLTVEHVFERVTNEVAELLPYDRICIALVDSTRTRLRVEFELGLPAPAGPYELESDDGEPLQLAWRSRVIPDIAEGDAEVGPLREAGLGSMVEVSLGTGGSGVIGYLALMSTSAAMYGERDRELLQLVAGQVTPAIQNALSHEQLLQLADARAAEAKAEARSRELEKLNQAKSRFLGVVSHELRTPLTSIVAYSELLERNTAGNLNERQIHQSSVIMKSAAHLKFLIGDLLDVSRIESGNLSLEISRIELVDLIVDLKASLQPVLDQKNQRLEVHAPARDLALDADSPRITQVLSNLIENASKYSPPDTVVTVDVIQKQDQILITVSDEGQGISDEDQMQLFTPFFRVNSELTRTEPGTGLGLALVKKITELHGGTVSVESAPGEGSKFTVAFRAASNAKAA